jgi:hypothetical protein
MITSAESAAATIRQMVRGERPLTDLVPLGMDAGPQESRCYFLASFPADTRVTVHDLARGFLTYLHDATRLQDWAFVMEAMPADVDVENHPAGETVLNALWSASFGEPLSDDQLAVLKALGEEESKKT